MNKTEVRSLAAGEINFTLEAKRIQRLACSGQTHVVKLGEIVFFSTHTGDAWMLDWQDQYAVCLARDFETRPIPIKESAQRMLIEWNADYQIDGAAFTVIERNGSGRTILGYPTREIQRLVNEFPTGPEELSPETRDALARLKTARNDFCPCGSGKKYKKCCLATDEAAARKLAGTRAQNPSRAECKGDLELPSDPERGLG
jgi:SEC-C motif